MYTYRVKLRVADSVHLLADADLGFNCWLRNEPFRLRGIDAPEIRGSERPAGLKSKAALDDLLRDLAGPLTIRTHKDKRGKYGRWICDLWQPGLSPAEDVSVNTWLCQQGYAEPRVY